MRIIQLLLALCLLSVNSFSQDLSQKKIIYPEDKISEHTLIIEPYMQHTNGAFFTKLTLVSDNPYVEHISGFNFEWGYRYQLRVRETIYANPPQDVSDRSYALIEVLYQTKAYENFEMILLNEFYLSEPKEESVIKLKNGEYRYHDNMIFSVPPKLRAEFERKMKNKIYCKGVFTFEEDGSIHLLKLK